MASSLAAWAWAFEPNPNHSYVDVDHANVPAVSEWGMGVLGMLLLIGLTVKFRQLATVA